MKLDKKDTKQTIFIIMFSALMLWAVLNYKLFIDLIKFIFKLLMPLIVGIAIAFIVNVPMKQLERKIFKVDKRKHKKLVRLISLFLSIICNCWIEKSVFNLLIISFLIFVISSKELTLFLYNHSKTCVALNFFSLIDSKYFSKSRTL